MIFHCKDKPSEAFLDAVCNFGTPSADCQFCGITHFASGPQNCNTEEELSDLQKKAKESPERYLEHADFDSIAMGLLDGKQAVWGCPCNGASRYEQFIWSHKEIILEYLARRAKEQRSDVKNLEEMLAKVGS